ncbi:MAG TPA: Flp pilus assembly protein CpaB [Brevundimonas sp.]|jgi:pilus assembly protein CpaB|uniref:Flp pilus assembly protein CpaB n=1 Tax=Brevundimonas sp. TaxID=1871086 RepID=UPI002E10EF8E|nr:Flp pilus assembly protein CpaB [Brevundimonas sp.]
MKPARIAVIAVAAVSAIGLALVVRAMMGGEPTATATASVAEVRPMAKVLVAARDLQPGQRLADADLEWKDWAVEDVNPVFITDGSVPIPQAEAAADAAAEADEEDAGAAAARRVAEAAEALSGGGAKADFVGAVVREPILAGEPIVTRKIVRAGDSGYMAAYLQPGMRAMAVRVSVETAAGGFILPGDRVDVLLTREMDLGNAGTPESARSRFASSTVMQNVKVLAIDQTTRADEDEQAVVGATATLELGPRDAEALALARSEGELSLVLRSYADTNGPSGRVAAPRTEARAVRVHRGDDVETVVVQ